MKKCITLLWLFNFPLLLYSLTGGICVQAHAGITQVASLTADSPESLAAFGSAVALDGDVLAVGAPDEDAGGTVDSGAVYIFHRNTGGKEGWGLVKRLSLNDSDQNYNHGFGTSVAVSGDIAVVGAPGEIVYGDVSAGAIYIYYRHQGGTDNWGRVKREIRTVRSAGDWFGASVAAASGILVAGSPGEDTAAGGDGGASYVYSRNYGGTDNWGLVKKLTPGNGEAGDAFGSSVTVSGGTVVVGAPHASSGMVDNAGAVFVFSRDHGGAGNWGEVKDISLGLFNAHGNDFFGGSVALHNDVLAVGAEGDDSAGTQAGAAYVYHRDQGGADNWGKVRRLTASDGDAYDYFGRSVGVSDTLIVAGALNQGDQDGYPNAGAVYAFSQNSGGENNWGEIAKILPRVRQDNANFGNSVAASGDTMAFGEPGRNTAPDGGGAANIFVQRFPWILFFPVLDRAD